jgi:hypothetical protein
MNAIVKLYKRIPLHPWWFGPLAYMGIGLYFNHPGFLATGFAMLLMMGSVFPWVKFRGLGKGYQLIAIHIFFLALGYQQYSARAELRPTQDICTAFNFIPGFGDSAIKLLGWLDFDGFSVAGLMCGVGGLIVAAALISGLFMAGRSTLAAGNHGFNMSEMSQPIIAIVYFVATLAIFGTLIFGVSQLSAPRR